MKCSANSCLKKAPQHTGAAECRTARRGWSGSGCLQPFCNASLRHGEAGWRRRACSSRGDPPSPQASGPRAPAEFLRFPPELLEARSRPPCPAEESRATGLLVTQVVTEVRPETLLMKIPSDDDQPWQATVLGIFASWERAGASHRAPRRIGRHVLDTIYFPPSRPCDLQR